MHSLELMGDIFEVYTFEFLVVQIFDIGPGTRLIWWIWTVIELHDLAMHVLLICPLYGFSEDDVWRCKYLNYGLCRSSRLEIVRVQYGGIGG